jgi:hypothetical protein
LKTANAIKTVEVCEREREYLVFVSERNSLPRAAQEISQLGTSVKFSDEVQICAAGASCWRSSLETRSPHYKFERDKLQASTMPLCGELQELVPHHSSYIQQK